MVREIKIYTVSDDGIIVYVGITGQRELGDRLNSNKKHCTRGNTATIEVIDSFYIDENSETGLQYARLMESYWIDQLRAWGYELKNSPRAAPYSPPWSGDSLIRLKQTPKAVTKKVTVKTSASITLYIPNRLLSWVNAISDRERRTKSNTILILLEDAVEAKEKDYNKK